MLWTEMQPLKFDREWHDQAVRAADRKARDRKSVPLTLFGETPPAPAPRELVTLDMFATEDT